MGVFNSEIQSLSHSKRPSWACQFATTHAVLSDGQLQSLVEAGERPPAVLKFEDLDN
jgi:hypothetical protein